MKDRSFADLVVGALACVSLLGLCAYARESEFFAEERRRRAAERWMLPRTRRRRRRTPEDDCRHCSGAGRCGNCEPTACRVCRGTGLQPRDEALLGRLSAIWDGIG